MASTAGKNTSKNKSTTRKTSSTSTKRNTTSGKRKNVKKPTRNTVDVAVKNEVMLIVLFAIAIFTFLCVVKLINGAAAQLISNVMFGLFGKLAYIIPIIVFFAYAFSISNKGNTVAIVKLVSAIVLVFLLGIISYMLMKQDNLVTNTALIKGLYDTSVEARAGGGVIFGLIAYGMHRLMGTFGTIFVVLVSIIISLVFITEKSFLKGVKKSSKYIYNTAREDAERMREYREQRYEARRRFLEEDAYDNYDVEEQDSNKNQRVRRIDKKARGVAPSSAMTLKRDIRNDYVRQDIHEITLLEDVETVNQDITVKPCEHTPGMPLEKTFLDELDYSENQIDELPEDISKDGFSDEYVSEDVYDKYEEQIPYNDDNMEMQLCDMPEPNTEDTVRKSETPAKMTKADKAEIADEEIKIQEHIAKASEEASQQKRYIFPPISLLKKGEPRKGDSSNQLKETAYRLQQTLQTFGVKVTITDISQGPSVTRYEMQPEQGVKVSKIVGLTDDIKLNLAATDIRIEAPIPGKAAVGIEVPNKENSAVALRDLLESGEFKNFQSNICFAVGKDISGQVVVTDIAKMPHMLIAGATGSGKSVCINTIIMSILYKANPADVKMIMIDPKVVELSIYNGIPHLMIPVVTDPKKASAALHWAVAEMTERYKKFADLNVRDLKGFNKAVEMGKVSSEGEELQKMPQIVIIVDELADLMMVAAGEVEESICRLAQLARACGIHLIIATQRPSVDVITGLIKANMPSRIAFSVSSGVDSRTILDMNGAEKLLGKGDMLFYPQGYSKPARVQGAFVSDSEVSDVVDFLRNQALGNVYNADIEQKISTMQSSGTGNSSGNGTSGANDVDAYFVDAGKFVIEKEKASIGMLQRVFKIGFNRAARIVDQLEAVGVVGAEEGTKPRRILMTMEQFEEYLQTEQL